MAQVAKKIQENTEIDYALDIVSISKFFARTETSSGYTSLKTYFLNIFKKQEKEAKRINYALRNLTLRVPQGSSLGVIGRNGSGKSTLLKCVTGIYQADAGSVDVKGRVAALIELGAGFHPDFSGRENLYLSSIMYGLSKKEIDIRFDEIIDFAELREVIDEPVRTYSSGMFMRLGFSIAIHVDPDVLLIDEVLSVGDAGFVNKCKERIDLLRSQGKTLMLVSHDLDSVERWCDEVVWLHEGEVKDRGEPRRVIDSYRYFIEKGEEAELFLENESSEVNNLSKEEQVETLEAVTENIKENKKERWGSREVEITSIKIKNHTGADTLILHPEDSLEVEINYKVNEAQEEVVFGIGINRADGLVVHGSNTSIERIKVDKLKKEGIVKYKIERLGLLTGSYYLDLAVHKEDGYPLDYHKNSLNFKVRSKFSQLGVYEPKHSWEFN